MSLLYHAYVYLEFLILACTIYILAPALQSLDAVKNGRVYPIMLSEMYASATRTQDGVETFAKGLYPDVAID